MTKARDLANAGTALSAVSATELAFLDGVTSAVQTQIDGKQAVNANVSTTELGYLDGVTSAIQTQLDAKTAKSTLTTTGDIYYASGANTPARLGIGSSAQVLTVSGGIPSWATASSGGMTLLSTTTLSGASTTISVSSTGYIRLMIDITGVTNATGNGEFWIEPNSQVSLGFVVGIRNELNAETTSNFRGDALYLSGGYQLLRTDAINRWTVIIDYPADAYHPVQIYGGANTSVGNLEVNFTGITINNAITALKFVNNGGNFSTGTVKVYGVK
jgi:hypothetical protein